MKLFENYNSAVQKYDKNLVVCLSKQGLPPQYLLSACRFVQNEGASIDVIVPQFKEWTRYVVKYNKQCDVNRFSYSDFLEMIAKQKRLHSVPNLIYKDKTASLGKLNSAKDVQFIPVRNQWCIKSQKWFDNYTSKGYVFFVIYLPNEPLPFTYVIAAIHGGNVEYYDSQDYEQFEDLRGGNENNSDHEIYQRKLPQEIISYLYNIAAEQGEKLESMNYNENKQYNMKQVIRLTEGDLHRIIRNCVNEAIDEGNFWNNVQGALQGAVGGYKARKNFNNKQNWQNTLNQRGVPVDSPNRDGINANYQISKEINDLYQNVGWFASEWQERGWSDVRSAQSYIQRIEGNLNNIKQAFNSQTTQDDFGFAKHKPLS